MPLPRAEKKLNDDFPYFILSYFIVSKVLFTFLLLEVCHQPLRQHLAVMVVVFHEWHMTTPHEEFPLAIGQCIGHGLGDGGRTEILAAADHQRREADVLHLLQILEVLQVARGIQLVGYIRRYKTACPTSSPSSGTRENPQ